MAEVDLVGKLFQCTTLEMGGKIYNLRMCVVQGGYYIKYTVLIHASN